MWFVVCYDLRMNGMVLRNGWKRVLWDFDWVLSSWIWNKWDKKLDNEDYNGGYEVEGSGL